MDDTTVQNQLQIKAVSFEQVQHKTSLPLLGLQEGSVDNANLALELYYENYTLEIEIIL